MCSREEQSAVKVSHGAREGGSNTGLDFLNVFSVSNTAKIIVLFYYPLIGDSKIFSHITLVDKCKATTK